MTSLLIEDGKVQPEVSSDGKAMGIDLGLTDFAIISEGSKFANPRHFKKHERNLKRKQRNGPEVSSRRHIFAQTLCSR